MGVKTPLSPAQLQEFFPCTLLIPTADGVSDTVYRCDQGVLKLFETASEGAVREEAALLGMLRPLPVPELLMEPFTLHGKPCALYAALRGESLKKAEPHHIVQIARFIRDFHHLSAKRRSSNTPLFTPERLKGMIAESGSEELMSFLHLLDLQLANDGIIHGDLFLDNALFEEDLLCGVLDFIEACEGDFLFDLAVVALSWCLPSRENVELLLEHYGAAVDYETFLPYMRYALLYYATTRYRGGRDYRALLNQLTHLTKETP